MQKGAKVSAPIGIILSRRGAAVFLHNYLVERLGRTAGGIFWKQPGFNPSVRGSGGGARTGLYDPPRGD